MLGRPRLFVALLEADRRLAKTMMAWLEAAGHDFTCCSQPQEFLACLDCGRYDLLVVDCRCEDDSCFTAIEKAVHQPDGRIPLLFVSDADAREQIVRALAHGADDYIVKPLQRQEWLSRMEILVQRFPRQPAVSARIQNYGPFRIDPEQRLISRYGKPVEVTGKDFSLACYLFSHRDELLSRHRLLADVWGLNEAVNTRTLDVHISRLRKALLLEGTGYQIRTVHQYGYRLEQDETDN